MSSLLADPLWPRAGHWIVPVAPDAPLDADLALIGVPAYRTSITPTGACATPAAVRDALLRYSTYSAERDVDVSFLRAVDLGDVEEPDGRDGEARTAAAVARIASGGALPVAIGGDNSITCALVRALAGEDLAGWGLVTLDAHHDLRDGETNGSPVRRLLDAGLPGANIVQIGIADFANSAAYTARARDAGITVVPRGALRGADLVGVATRALEIAGAGGRPVFVDIDVDVCDRAVAPGCPASVPGGLSADELRQLVYALASDPRTRGFDITEIDATADATDRRTVRLAALLVLEIAAGLATRG
jgi:formiminoglutamase